MAGWLVARVMMLSSPGGVMPMAGVQNAALVSGDCPRTPNDKPDTHHASRSRRSLPEPDAPPRIDHALLGGKCHCRAACAWRDHAAPARALSLGGRAPDPVAALCWRGPQVLANCATTDRAAHCHQHLRVHAFQHSFLLGLRDHQ